MSTPLKPDKTIQKILISTPAHITGEFERDEFLISQAFADFEQMSINMALANSPQKRTGLLIAFRTESPKVQKGVILPSYSDVGDIVCAYLSVLFGKRFDNHGVVEENGIFRIPSMQSYYKPQMPLYIFNSDEPRAEKTVKLNLEQVSKIYSLILKPNNSIYAMCKFYMQALQNAESDPEVAYLHLITAGEILAGQDDYKKEEVLNEQLLADINAIKKSNIDGADKVAKRILEQHKGIRKSFTISLFSRLEDSFYLTHEDIMKREYAFTTGNIEQYIKAAYDLRSDYVHSGIGFGNFIKPERTHYDCVCPARIIEGMDRKFAKAIKKSPTFMGLERLIRFCILKYIDNHHS